MPHSLNRELPIGSLMLALSSSLALAQDQPSQSHGIVPVPGDYDSLAHHLGGDLGGRPKTSAKKESLVLRLREEGESYRSIKEQTGLALATITRIVKEQEAMA